ncbi:MAG: phage holin [Clostridia bacterium]|nr:phage holin [Clostridia bacterium]
MKINIKERLKNKVFLLAAFALIISFVYQLLGMFGVVPPITENEVLEIVAMGINILAFFGVLVDPTTAGMSDSERALTYGTSYDVRIPQESTTSKIDSHTIEKENYPIEAHPVSENDNVTDDSERSDE